MTENLIFEAENDVGVIRFCDLKRRNALSELVLDRLSELVQKEAQGLRKLVFTGTEDIFAAGANIAEVAQLDSETAYEFSKKGQSVFASIRDLKGTTIAAINGHCMGGALDLALSCDVRIAKPGAYFAHPGAKLGIITGWGGTQMLPRQVGVKKANEIFLTAKKIDSVEALDIGLIDEIDSDPLGRAFEYEV